MHRLACSIIVRCWRAGSFYDVDDELSGGSLICVRSVKIADKDLAQSDCSHLF